MTWNGRCRACHGWLFELTISSGGWVNVNCADPECSAYIGKIPQSERYVLDGADALVEQEH